MAVFSAWNRDNLERVANEMLVRLVNNPCEKEELHRLLLLKANIKQQAEMNWEFISDDVKW